MSGAFDPAGVARRVVATEIAGLEALHDALAGPLGAALAEAVDVIGGRKGRLVCSGIGKSGHVARKIAATLASTGTPAQFVHATEASHGDLGMIGGDDAVLALSWSGGTAELTDLVAYAKRFAIPLIAMTAQADSPLGRAADVPLILPAAREACGETRAPTTSTILQMALGDALAVALLERRGFTAEDFRIFHPGGKLGSALMRVGDLMHSGPDMPVVGPETPMLDALLAMTAGRMGCVGVADGDGRLAGIVTDGDVRRRAARGLGGLVARECMSANPLTIGPDALAGEAVALMNARSVTVLFAVDADRRPLGILHMHDLLKAGLA